MKFKNIKATFKVVEDTSFKNGEWKKDRSDFVFEVNRYVSGAFAYGDRSGHSISITDSKGEWYMPKYYDTRYSRIGWEKDSWVKYWKEFIEEEWMLKVELKDYEESYEEIKD